MANTIFTPSATVQAYQNKAQEYEKQVQQALNRLQSSSLGVAVQDALNRIANRLPFSYDVNADGLYQQYKQQYTALGNTAMRDTVARGAELTGGYGNSYAVSAGNQAYNQYMEQLNNKIPELYQLAYQRYNDQTKELEGEYNRLAALEQQEYARTQNQVEALWQLAEYYAELGNNQLDYEMNLWQTAMDNAYRNRQLEYQMGRDAVKDSQWAKEYALAVQKAAQTKQETEVNLNMENPYTQWSAQEWESYFAGLRQKYGKDKALGMLQRMVREGAIPQNMITFGRIGAQGGMTGH